MTERFDRIFNRVLEWADENEVCDCEADARQELEFLLNHDYYVHCPDDALFEMTVEAWLAAE